MTTPAALTASLLTAQAHLEPTDTPPPGGTSDIDTRHDGVNVNFH